MKKILLFCISFLLLSCSSQKLPTSEHKESLTIVSASDSHYYSASLSDYQEGFQNIIAKGDGKLLSNSDQIMDELIMAAINHKADYLLISGDLTFNGEKASHEDLAAKLKYCEEQGIEVFVIPGNHDLNNPYARSFFEDMYYKEESITEEDFRNIYRDFGYRDTYMDNTSLSYCAALSDDLYLLAIDADGYSQYQGLDPETVVFVEKCLKMIQEADAEVLVMTHENVLIHNERFYSYVLRNHNEIYELFKKYDVRLNLSGHMHIQHSKTEENLLEIVQASISIPSHHYGLLQIEQGMLDYSLQSLGFDQTESVAFFRENTVRKFKEQMDECSASDSEKELLLELMVHFNDLYFDGRLFEEKEDILNSEAYALCLKYQDEVMFADYLVQSLAEEIHDERHLSVSLKK